MFANDEKSIWSFNVQVNCLPKPVGRGIDNARHVNTFAETEPRKAVVLSKRHY